MRSAIILSAVAAFALAGAATAQSGAVAAGLDSGAVGEQVDGYLGFPKPPSGALKAEVDAINIKRRQVYTQAAQGKNVSIEEFAISAGCSTIGKLRDGRAYSVAPGVWATKSGTAKLPATCG
ncbi:YdbL family protein [Sphingomonas sp.]|uniref:YdbL family protein n=1 Tax=Sphingomonas sp. TaxID=28214 RepID=UPI003B003F38